MSKGVINFISMGKQRVLYISYDGLTDPLGQSQVLPYLVQLSQLNYEITILSTEKEENFLKNKQIIFQICNDNGIDWENIVYTKKPPVISTMKDVKALKKKANALYQENPFQIVHCRSYISALVGKYMKSKFGTRFIFDMRGFWADERIDGGIWNLKIPIFKLVYKFFKRQEKKFLLSADATVSLTFNGRNEIRSWDYMSDVKDNITVIPCCADLDHFDFNKDYVNKGLKIELGIPKDHKVITYLGSIGTWYMMEEMLDYFCVHMMKFPKTSFLWITKDDPSYIKSAAKERGILEHIFVKPANRSQLPSLLSICDASIFFIKPLFSKKASSPTKMAELLGMGIPLICNANVGDTDEIVRKEDVGIVINEFDESNYKLAVQQFESILRTPKSKLRDVAEKYFSLKDGVRKYQRIYEELSI